MRHMVGYPFRLTVCSALLASFGVLDLTDAAPAYPSTEVSQFLTNPPDFDVLLHAADQGDIDSQKQLADRYSRGDGVPEDLTKAARWYHLAAEQGDPEAQSSLGIMYMNGRGVKKNSDLAIKWYRLAAEQNHARAQYNLGLLYEKGEGVPKSDSEALRWHRLAAEQRYSAAQYNLGVLYATGRDGTNSLLSRESLQHNTPLGYFTPRDKELNRTIAMPFTGTVSQPIKVIRRPSTILA